MALPSTDETLIHRLPLPLAQLYRRAQNAKTSVDRFHTAFYLWEASLKLMCSLAVVEYAEQPVDDPALHQRLQNLARPLLGHWWEITRLLFPILALSDDAGFRTLQDWLLGKSRTDVPRAVRLDALLREELNGDRASQNTVCMTELFHRLVELRNREIGHGAAGKRDRDFYARMGDALLDGMQGILSRFDVLAGRRLTYVSDVSKKSDGTIVVERLELKGETPRRLPPLRFTSTDLSIIPLNRTIGIELDSEDEVRQRESFRSLHPLAWFDDSSYEFFFINGKSGKQKAHYLCYWTGPMEETPKLVQDRRELLARVLGMPVDDGTLTNWQVRSTDGDLPESGPEPRSDRRIGEFELLSRIGRGGMGVVYRAWQPSLERQVALKCALRDDPKAEERFAREIRALGRVEHPHLVKIFNSGTDGDNWFYAMEVVDGVDLGFVGAQLTSLGDRQLEDTAWQHAVSTAWEKARTSEEPLAHEESPPAVPVVTEPAESWEFPKGKAHVPAVVEIIRQVAEAAHALHEAGVVHRDIKPGNIMIVGETQHAVLMDLGLAQLADETSGRLTRTRQFVGTLRYASPEQVLSLDRVDRRSDVYSLGATLWELLALHPMFAADDRTATPELMRKIQTDEPERIRKYNRRVAPDLESIVFKCLEKNPDRRYPTADELAKDLRRWQRGEPVVAQPLTVRYVLSKWIARRRIPLGIAAGVLCVIVAALVTAVWRDHQVRSQSAARAQVDVVLTAEPERLTDEIHKLQGMGSWAYPYLRELLDQGPSSDGLTDEQRLRASVALAAADPQQVSHLVARLPTANTELVPAIADAIATNRQHSVEPLWSVLEDTQTDGIQRLRSAMALGKLDPPAPDAPTIEARWTKVAPFLSRETASYLAVHPNEFLTVVNALRPAGQALLDSLLNLLTDEELRAGERTMAVGIFREYAASDLTHLIQAILVVDPAGFEQLLPYVERSGRPAIYELEKVIATPPAADWTAATKEEHAKRLANAVAALLRIGSEQRVWPLLKDQSDLTTQSYIVHNLAAFDVPPQILLRRLNEPADPAVLRSLILSLGEYPSDQIPADQKAPLLEQLVGFYHKSSDAGVRGAAEWLVRKWGAEQRLADADQQLPKSDDLANLTLGRPAEPPRWYVNSRGQTMAVISGPITFEMGQSDRQSGGGPPPADLKHPVTIGHSFAIATKEVTVREFQSFLQALRDPGETGNDKLPGPLKGFSYVSKFSPDDLGPQVAVSWFQAAAYCRWLSEQEGIPEEEMCFPPIDKIGDGMTWPGDYLERTGYRLPTEAEWEYACRGGTDTTWHCGNTEALLSDYAWYNRNNFVIQAYRGGQKKPNPFGMFDMYGNGWEWCLDVFAPYDESGDAVVDQADLTTDFKARRVLRGGGLSSTADELRAGDRSYTNPPNSSGQTVVCRIARTLRHSTPNGSAPIPANE